MTASGLKKIWESFQVPVPQENEDGQTVPFEYSESKIVDTSFLFKPQGVSNAANAVADVQVPAPEAPKPSIRELPLEDLANLKLETKEIIEKVVWRLVPEMASQMIKEELDRLLNEEK